MPTEEADFASVFIVQSNILLAKASYTANVKVKMCICGYIFHPSCPGHVYIIMHSWGGKHGDQKFNQWGISTSLCLIPLCILPHTFGNKVSHNNHKVQEKKWK